MRKQRRKNRKLIEFCGGPILLTSEMDRMIEKVQGNENPSFQKTNIPDILI